jgi:hypothetical protein
VATLTGANVSMVWSDGLAERVAMYALRKVTAGDTYDLSNDFNPPICATIVGTAGAAAGACAVMAAPSGNVVTIPTGPSSSGGFMMVWGVHA